MVGTVWLPWESLLSVTDSTQLSDDGDSGTLSDSLKFNCLTLGPTNLSYSPFLPSFLPSFPSQVTLHCSCSLSAFILGIFLILICKHSLYIKGISSLFATGTQVIFSSSCFLTFLTVWFFSIQKS